MGFPWKYTVLEGQRGSKGILQEAYILAPGTLLLETVFYVLLGYKISHFYTFIS